MTAIQDYYENGLSLLGICEKYDITKHTIVRGWLHKYNNHVEFKDEHDGRNDYMVKGRNTTFEERVEIIRHCIANNKDYTKTIEQYCVSYQQVYGWVRKYEKDGADALIDRRGKRKDEASMSEAEKLRTHLKLKEAENQRLQMENKLLKN